MPVSHQQLREARDGQVAARVFVSGTKLHRAKWRSGAEIVQKWCNFFLLQIRADWRAFVVSFSIDSP